MPKILFTAGALLALGGVICFIAMLGQGHSEPLVAIGSAGFSLGALVIALGFYLQAARIRSSLAAKNGKSRKAERLCSVCNQEQAGVFCRVHVLRLCSSCLEKHDDGKNCLYVPAYRAAAAYK